MHRLNREAGLLALTNIPAPPRAWRLPPAAIHAHRLSQMGVMRSGR